MSWRNFPKQEARQKDLVPAGPSQVHAWEDKQNGFPYLLIKHVLPGPRPGLRCYISFVLRACFLPHSLPCKQGQQTRQRWERSARKHPYLLKVHMGAGLSYCAPHSRTPHPSTSSFPLPPGYSALLGGPDHPQCPSSLLPPFSHWTRPFPLSLTLQLPSPTGNEEIPVQNHGVALTKLIKSPF